MTMIGLDWRLSELDDNRISESLLSICLLPSWLWTLLIEFKASWNLKHRPRIHKLKGGVICSDSTEYTDIGALVAYWYQAENNIRLSFRWLMENDRPLSAKALVCSIVYFEVCEVSLCSHEHGMVAVKSDWCTLMRVSSWKSAILIRLASLTIVTILPGVTIHGPAVGTVP